MKLLFTGTTPAWMLLLFFLAVSAGTIALYRRHNLRRPWSFWLPAARILAFALLILTLFQPVIARIRVDNIRGRIPVIVDNSGSMSIRESGTPAQMVRTAARLELFPPELRTADLSETTAEIARIGRILAEIAGLAEKHHQALTASSRLSAELAKEVKQQESRIDDEVDAVQDLAKALQKLVDGSDYLDKPGTTPRQRTGGILYERFDGIAGITIGELQNAAKYPDRPDVVTELPRFEAGRNAGDNFGARFRGYLHPPVSGDYVLMLTSDDQGQLFLSTDDKPANMRLMGHVPDWTEFNNYAKYPDKQTSPVVHLEKGKRYYIEALQKEGLVNDHFAAGWKLPGGHEEKPIPGKYLSPFGAAMSHKAFRHHADELRNRLTGIEKMLSAAADTAGDLGSKLEKPGPAKEHADKLRNALREAAKSWNELATDASGLQDLADDCLANAGIQEIDAAIESLKSMTRLDMVTRLLDAKKAKGFRTALGDIGDVDIFALTEPVAPLTDEQLHQLQPGLPSTRLGSVLNAVLNQYAKGPVAGVLLFTDGNNNAGKSMTEAGEVLGERDIPLFCIGVGRTAPPRDISVERVQAPTTSFKGDTLNVQAVIHRYGYEATPLTVKVFAGDQQVHEHVVPPGPEAVVTANLSFVEDGSGFRHYRVVAVKQDDEALDLNNEKTCSVNILTDPVRALLVDEFPRWESRYANMMLKRDRRIDFQTIFIGSTKDGKLPVGDGAYPVTPEDLFGYHIVILGDVNPTHFSNAQLMALRDFVLEKGGTLVLMAGPNHMPEFYRNTPLAAIMPFKVQPSGSGEAAGMVPTGKSVGDALGLSLTEYGKQEALVQIGHSWDATAELWEGLPGVNWVRKGVYPARHADFLVQTKAGNQPVMLTAYAGLGKVMYLGSDSFWRWRYRARWKYHHRFWGQVLLWATLGRTSGSDKHVKLMTDRPNYSPGETVTLRARVLDDAGRPLEDGTVSADILDGKGATLKSVHFVHLEKSGGEYRAQVRDLTRGKYTAVPHVLELENAEIKADYPFEIKDLPTSEYIDLSLDETELRAVATEYRPFDTANELLDRVPEIRVTEEHRQDAEVWDSFYLLLLVTALLAFEWQMRKKLNLV